MSERETNEFEAFRASLSQDDINDIVSDWKDRAPKGSKVVPLKEILLSEFEYRQAGPPIAKSAESLDVKNETTLESEIRRAGIELADILKGQGFEYLRSIMDNAKFRPSLENLARDFRGEIEDEDSYLNKIALARPDTELIQKFKTLCDLVEFYLQEAKSSF